MLSNLTAHTMNFAAIPEPACKVAQGIPFLPPWYKYLDFGPDVAGRCTPRFSFENATDITRVLVAIVELLLRVGGMVAVAFIIWGGIQYVLSQGSPDKTKAAKDTIVNAIIGLVVVMLATAIINFVGTRVL